VLQRKKNRWSLGKLWAIELLKELEVLADGDIANFKVNARSRCGGWETEAPQNMKTN